MVFHVLLPLMVLRKFCFAWSSFMSIVHSIPSVVVEFDASLSGIGILWFLRSNDSGREILLGGIAVDITSWEFEGYYEFAAEFIAGRLGVRGTNFFPEFRGEEKVVLRGDSITALTWTVYERIFFSFRPQIRRVVC